MEPIIHICTQADWASAEEAGEYRADSLDTEGFIHCSRPDQVVRVANAYYPGMTDLVLLWIDPSKLVADLRWEPVENDVFPHVYGPLNLAAIFRASAFPPDPDGVFRSLPK